MASGRPLQWDPNRKSHSLMAKHGMPPHAEGRGWKLWVLNKILKSLGSGLQTSLANMPVFELFVKCSNRCDTSLSLLMPTMELGRPQISFKPTVQGPFSISQNRNSAGALRSKGWPGCLPPRTAKTGERRTREMRERRRRSHCFPRRNTFVHAL